MISISSNKTRFFRNNSKSRKNNMTQKNPNKFYLFRNNLTKKHDKKNTTQNHIM